MTFLNLSLLAGAGLVTLPIVLHFMMKRQPKQHVFPALRFVKRRQIANSQQLQIRHWLLLALRCAALALAALALARPSVPSAAMGSWVIAGCLAVAAVFLAVVWITAATRRQSRAWLLFLALAVLLTVLLSGGFAVSALRNGVGPLVGDTESPVAAAIIVDTSPHMQYRSENRTRLEVAQEMAQWLLRQLPADSEVAILDTSSTITAFSLDLAGAQRSIMRLQTGAGAQPLPDVLERAHGLLQRSELTRREFYVLTDLTESAWRVDAPESWSARWGSATREMPTYVIDVGVEAIKNMSLDELQLSAEALPRGGELVIQSNVRSVGLEGHRTVDVLLDDPDPNLPVLQDEKLILPKSIKRSTQAIDVTPESVTGVQFNLRGLTTGVHNGVVQIRGEDGLPVDDERYFTVEVEEARPVLVVASVNDTARNFAEAIAPEALRDRGESRFSCDIAAERDLATLELAKFEAICLLDPGPLTPDVWNRLANFAREGKGVALFLGARASPVEPFNDPAARAMIGGRLGGRLKQPVRTVPGDAFFAPDSLAHPIFTLFRSRNTSVPWDQFPVYYYWPLDQLANDSRVVATFSDRKPAIVETSLGKGRVLTFTTPAAEPLQPNGRPCWNELWAGEDAWPWFVLLNESLRYVAGLGEGRLNYMAGETARLQNDPQQRPARYQVFTPNGDVQDVSARDNFIALHTSDRPGTYRLRGNFGGPMVRGFSTNYPATATDLKRIAPTALENLLGKDRFYMARNGDEIHRVVGQQRIGQELYPFVIVFVVSALALEQLFANRFYRGEENNAGPSQLPRPSPTGTRWWTGRFGWKGNT